MEIILYITGGVALLALAWLLLIAAKAIHTAEKVLEESQKDFHSLTMDVREMKNEVQPIIVGVNDLTRRANNIVDGIQSQIVTIQGTVDSTLDVVRGTIDDVERIKNEVVDIVEGPLRMARGTTVQATSAILKILSLAASLFGTRRNGKER